jgi:hypothetical protein
VTRQPPIPQAAQDYAEWHKAAYGWSPFESRPCGRCGGPVALNEIYRCYECQLGMQPRLLPSAL